MRREEMRARMLMLYFSGTGNSRYVAEQFSARMGAACHSIEEGAEFDALIAKEEIVAFCYPIYGSCVPRIMREFAVTRRAALEGKKLIIFCTQMMFSGDGARVFTDLLPGSAQRVIYAEHFNMPNNICNVRIFPIRDSERIRKQKGALKKLDRVCGDIECAVAKKRGWGKLSHLLGLTQSAFWPDVEVKKSASFAADSDCNRCGLCAKLCPVQNLSVTPKGVSQSGKCMLCYRCVNACPKKAATVLINKKPTTQYKGIEQ